MKLHQNREWLYQKYIIEELSISRIAKIYKVNNYTIYKWLKIFNIPRRPFGFCKGHLPYNKGIPQTKEVKEKNRLAHLGKPAWNKGLKAEDDIRIKKFVEAGNKANRGKPSWNSGMKIKTNTGRTHFKKGQEPYNKGLKGINSSHWLGGRKKSLDKYYIRKRKDVKFILNNRMSCSIRDCLKRGVKNRIHWEYSVGYTLKDLERRLRKTIPNSYVWKDFLSGELHIDHIIPIRLFQFDSPEDKEFKQCWSLCNLRLLPSKENAAKRDKITNPILLGLLLKQEKSFQPALAI